MYITPHAYNGYERGVNVCTLHPMLIMVIRIFVHYG